MALYHKWDVKNGLAYVLQFFSLISVGLGGVNELDCIVLLIYFELNQRTVSILQLTELPQYRGQF